MSKVLELTSADYTVVGPMVSPENESVVWVTSDKFANVIINRGEICIQGFIANVSTIYCSRNRKKIIEFPADAVPLTTKFRPPFKLYYS
jgi:hypothetical protein